ncbi:MAG: hypothetical protein J6N78_04615 [Clostridia bacterium]|nr:hypothetical protein [Clostridia bacterium]
MKVSKEEYKKSFKSGSKKTHKFKITNSWGVYDYFKWFRKNNYCGLTIVINEKVYYNIIRTINNYYASALINGEDIQLPERMGTIKLRKLKREVYRDKNGKVKTNLPVDWDRTLDLWYIDEEARREKKLIRFEPRSGYRLRKIYDKTNATFNNKSFFEFKIIRKVFVNINKRVSEGILNLYKTDNIWNI